MKLLAGIFLGWSLGTNDAANVFGTAVSSQMVRWRTAAILIAVFVIIGAVVDGGEGLETYSKISTQDQTSAFGICLASALTVTLMTLLQIPVSTSQAVVGAIIGSGLSQISLGTMARSELDFSGMSKVGICWIATPIGAAIAALIFYPLLSLILRRMRIHFLDFDGLMRTLLILAGIYGAYALGANNVANVTGVFYKAGAFGDDPHIAKILALLVGGGSIAFGAITYSKSVMMTVGKKIIPLDAFSAFIVVLSEAIVVHIFAIIGVPVSTSQAVVGAVVGIGLLKGMRTISIKTLFKIFAGWIVTPCLGLAIAYIIHQISVKL